jgi:hypothetical protein
MFGKMKIDEKCCNEVNLILVNKKELILDILKDKVRSG